MIIIILFIASLLLSLKPAACQTLGEAGSSVDLADFLAGPSCIGLAPGHCQLPPNSTTYLRVSGTVLLAKITVIQGAGLSTVLSFLGSVGIAPGARVLIQSCDCLKATYARAIEFD